MNSRKGRLFLGIFAAATLLGAGTAFATGPVLRGHVVVPPRAPVQIRLAPPRAHHAPPIPLTPAEEHLLITNLGGSQGGGTLHVLSDSQQAPYTIGFGTLTTSDLTIYGAVVDMGGDGPQH